MRLLRSSILKLRRRPATKRTLLVLAGLLTVIYLGMAVSATQQADPALRASMRTGLELPGALVTVAQMLLIFGGLAGAAYGGMVAGSEWNWSTFRVALARGESRVRYILGLLVAVAVLAFAAWMLLYVLGLGLIVVTATVSGFHPGDPLDPAILGRHLGIIVIGWWALLMQVALAFAVSFIARSTVVGVGTVMGVFLLELFVGSLVPRDLLALAPITAATNLVTVAAESGIVTALVAPLLVTTAYLLLAAGAASVAARAREVA